MGEREGKYFDEPDSADLYVKYRPHVPIEVYQYVADLCATQQSNGTDGEDDGHGAGRRLALDTGCGSGQSTVPLAEYFDKVIGVDLNGEQLTRAPKHERVSFRVGPGESFPYLEDGSVDLAICVDALHWLDVTELMKEMRRVLRDDGVFCGVYFPFGNLDLKEADEAFDKMIHHDTLEYHPSAWLCDDYKYNIDTLRIGESHVHDTFEMKKVWSVDGFIGYIAATALFLKDIPSAQHILPEFKENILEIYRRAQPGVPDEDLKLTITWPIKLFITRNTSS